MWDTAYYLQVLQFIYMFKLFTFVRTSRNDSSEFSCCCSYSVHGVCKWDCAKIFVSMTLRFYDVQNEKRNEISIPPMKLEHSALVLYKMPPPLISINLHLYISMNNKVIKIKFYLNFSVLWALPLKKMSSISLLVMK